MSKSDRKMASRLMAYALHTGTLLGKVEALRSMVVNETYVSADTVRGIFGWERQEDKETGEDED